MRDVMNEGIKELKKDGFVEADSKIQRRRIICSVEGQEKEGKTHWAFTAPAPIAYINIDTGGEGVVEKFKAAGKEILEMKIDSPDDSGGENVVRTRSVPVWNQIAHGWRSGLAHARTTIVDTGTEAWEILRLARFGKVTQIMPHHYGPVNAEFRRLIRESYDSDSNLILIHKQKKQYVNDKWSGKYERSGFNDIGFGVQVLMYSYREAEGFHTQVLDCRQNASLKWRDYEEVPGVELAPMTGLNSFAALALDIFPDTSIEDWT
jgi:hypothetical protein